MIDKNKLETVSLFIDHTLLVPWASKIQITKICSEAKKYNFKSVCVNPIWVKLCSGLLKNSNAKLCTVVGFPLGASTTKIKVEEAKDALKNGADEVDAVMNLGEFKSKNYSFVLKELKALRKILKNKIFKVIIESPVLNSQEIIKACRIVQKSGADFIKTSTGYNVPSTKISDVRLINKILDPKIKIKASGGIRTFSKALKMINAGASRLGTSSSLAIISK
ncbi:deoxyribose-phosphate aldolase [Elusimicrobiota bacterium]